MGDSENGKVQKDSPKPLTKGEFFLGVAKMVKCKKTALKPLIKGKVPFGRCREL